MSRHSPFWHYPGRFVYLRSLWRGHLVLRATVPPSLHWSSYARVSFYYGIIHSSRPFRLFRRRQVTKYMRVTQRARVLLNVNRVRRRQRIPVGGTGRVSRLYVFPTTTKERASVRLLYYHFRQIQPTIVRSNQVMVFSQSSTLYRRLKDFVLPCQRSTVSRSSYVFIR